MDLQKINKIHFIGVGGIYASALALLLLKFNKDVSGCDIDDSEIMAKLVGEGVDVKIGHEVEHISDDLDLVVYSSAVLEDNFELKEAQNFGIKIITVYELLGELSKDLFSVVVSGTKGKTTTTILTGLILMEAELDPTVVVGGKTKELTYGNLRVGDSKYLVAEGCEFKAQMLSLHPNITVITNIEEDHLDYYKDLQHIIETFKKYTQKLPKDGFLIINNDEINCQKLGCHSGGSLITYGIDQESDVMAKNIKIKNGTQCFDLYLDGIKVQEIVLRIPGKFNIYNALGAISVAIQLEVKFVDIAKAIEKFQGSWRRFEKIGECSDALVISDYAHTPSSVKNVISATKEFYPNKRIISVFQPHLHSRTKKLFNEFVKAFGDSDFTIISDIYYVEGRVEEDDQDVSSAQLVDAIARINKGEVFHGGDLSETKDLILGKIEKDDIVLIIGAGDIYKMGEDLCIS